MREYSKRDKKEYNLFRAIFQWLTAKVAYGLWYRIACDYRIYGRENIPHDRFVIVASNHLSAIDPFLILDALGHPTAYMAKQELFERPVMRFFLDLLGAFAVNRDKLSVSTIKTAIAIKDTKWFLGLFPQGKREREDNMDNISQGFVKIARLLKCDILPVGISGATQEQRKPFKNGKIVINIGKPIPYTEDTEKMSRLWVKDIQYLTQNIPKQKSHINYAQKKAKELNFLTRLYQIYATKVVFPLLTCLFYKIKFEGKKNIDKKAQYIIAPNHISYFDPFITAIATQKATAFMAKKELFEDKMEHWGKEMRRLGAFSVNREKMELATLKSAKEVFKTKFDLCIYPQGGIRRNHKIEEINGGFIYFAKMSKRDILPVSITGCEEYNWKLFNRKNVSVKIGKPISWKLENEEIMKEWCKQISEMTGYENCM